MSHKRRTRKQKEQAQKRRVSNVEDVVSSQPVYTIPSTHIIKRSDTELNSDTTSRTRTINLKQKSTQPMQLNTYLLQDIKNIVAAAGIVVAFDIVLYLLLARNIVRLPYIDY